MNYKIDLMDTETGHPVDHIVNNLPYIIKVKRHGAPDAEDDKPGTYLVIALCFSTPAQILTRDGLQICVPGDCIVVGPTFPEYHGSAPGEETGFVNDWLHMHVLNASAFEALDVPLNTLIHTGDPLFMRNELNLIREELLYRRDLYEEMTSGIVECLMIRLKRAYSEVLNPRMKTAYHTQLLDLRQEIAGSLQENWTVSRMAQALNLSPSRFSVVYREQFNASPLEDLILARLTAAKRMLLSTSLSLRAVAERCGFGSEYYFSRIFKSKVGIAPSEYRRK